ncbi:Ubiquitin carboxyl-terminal hydrolase 26 [Cardamine amara subsp. amara]|uniref:Ubiquitin carboxyl-terminal hydrolase 26 n=1 Tax=Cardamine amara subsp. amara TaxID=228776 RepID=A0ABD1A8B5_CARAN
MSRPNTRNKNKRQRPSDAVESSSQILRKIHEVNDVTDDDINQLFMIWKPVCQGCRVNTRDNPNCFCGLVPPVTGNRKSGLWQKTSEIIQSLGPDPSLDLRASDSTPAGLTNLGATCYANSILQCLYMNTAFREGVFSVDVDVLKQYPVLDQIARLFAQLHVSKKSFVDSDAFVKTLELDNGVQQDTHEFLTLLLSLLERCLSHSGNRKAKTIVQDLFRGSVSHVTTCSKCGMDSEASSKVEAFYALELNIKGLKTLDASLNDYLSLEQLDGDNQYFCGSCNARVDATRCIKLRTLPPVITFQLKRCVFLPKTTAKKKITSSFSFPQVLDMGSRLAESSQNELTYDLSAVLIHKGSAVNSGHYVAHIKDEKTGLWWEFDDETVSELGKRPFNEASSSSTPKSDSNGTVSSGNATDVQSGSSDCRSSTKSEVFTSSDAYMLIYSLRCSKQEDQDGQRENPIDITKEEVDSVQQLEGGHLPLHLYEWINNMNALFLESCKQFDLRKERELNALTERRQEVRTILSEAAVQSLEEQYFWISTDWLRLWADTTLPPALDNTPLLCSHGKVLASKVNCMKRISEIAWTKLESKFNGGPKLGKEDYCRDCLMDGARMVVSSDSYRDRRTFMKNIASDVLSGKCEDGMYYISRVWLQQWIKRKNLDAPSEADAGPTNAITCNHGGMMPEQAPGAKRVLVPENFWSFLVEDALKVIPEDTSGSTCFPLDSSQCCLCTEELSEVACLEDSLRTLKVKQRQNHEKLASGKGVVLTPQSRYFLLPSQWLVQWRSYINMTGKSSSSAPEPELLDGVINTLKCKKHTRLLERLPEVVCRRGSYFQKSPSTDKLTIIPEHDWKHFCEEWGGTMANGISALIEGGNNTDQSSSQDVIDLEKDSSPDDNMDIDAQPLILRTSPEICEECIGERESCELMQKLSYSEGDVFVHLVRGKEAPKAMLEASDSSFDVDRRTSKRSRRTNYGNMTSLKVSATTTVYQLKMMIWELLGVVKENQELHKGTTPIDQESATLADMNIFPGDRLWVRDSEIHEHRDIADELCDKKTGAQDIEAGFRGTLLTGDISSEAS